MKKIVSVMVFVLILGQTSASAFDWGSMLTVLSQNRTNTVSQNPNTSADVLKALASFQSQAQSVDNSVQNSFLSVVSQLSSPQEATILDSKISSILSNSTQNQEQKSVLINQLISNYTATLSGNKLDVAEVIGDMSNSERTELANNLAELAQNSKQYAELAKQGISTAKTMMKVSQNANDVLTTINTMRQTAANIKNRATTVANFVNRVRSISKYAGYFMQ
jgi:hypothetical protein